MQTFGAEVVPSPSMDTNTGRAILAKDPNTPGSLGIAISEALEDAVSREDTKYALGSVLNHVFLHQSIIGLEAKKQMEIAGEYPGCHHRLLRRRLQLCRPGRALPARLSGRQKYPSSSGSSLPPARR